MTVTSIVCYSDPGHGWGKVPLKTLKELGIEHKITSYSYVRGAYAYLEEDCDMSTFYEALKAKGLTLKVTGHTGDKQSRIRNYHSYNPDKIDWSVALPRHTGYGF